MNTTSFLRGRWKDGVIVALLIGTIFVLYHFTTIDRIGGLRLIYPLQAPLAKWQSHCSDRAPVWMHSLLDEVVDRQFSLANQLVYVEPDGLIHNCESGWRGKMLRSPAVDAGTRFRYASITKLLTADAVLAQVNTGNLALDTRLLDVVKLQRPLLDQRLSEITVGQLLNHRAGFDRLKSIEPMMRHAVKPWCPGDLEQLARQQLDFTPGERFAYSNLGYCLLGVVLEQISGKPFRELMEEEYGLATRGLRFIDGPYLDDEVSYDFRNSDFYGEDYYRYFDFPAVSSSAGLSGSAVSLASLVKEMLGREPLNLISMPLDGNCNSQQPFACYGFAVSPFKERGEALTLYAQSGFLFGASSQAVIDSEGGVLVWLGGGMSPQPQESSVAFVERLRTILVDHYQSRSNGFSTHE